MNLACLYRRIILTAVNVVLGFVLLNFLLTLVPSPCLPHMNPVTLKYGVDLAPYFPGWKEDDINEMEYENWSMPMSFDQAGLARFPAHTGRFVNIHPAGYRAGKDQCPWPLSGENWNIFVFGGSTTFGSSLPDSLTVPSYLQDSLRQREGKKACVYNFGMVLHFSSLERAWFESLLISNAVPDTVVFIDGLNEFAFADGIPSIAKLLGPIVEGRFQGVITSFASFLSRQPLVQLLDVSTQLVQNSFFPPAKNNSAPPPKLSQENLQHILDRYSANQSLIRAVSAAFDVTPVFVWQPAPVWDYDLGSHPFANGIVSDAEGGYRLMKQRLDHSGLPAGFVWCASHPAALGGKAYVDSVHYSPAMAKVLAECISAAVPSPNRSP